MTMALSVDVIDLCLTSGYRGDTFLVIAAVAISAVCDSLSDIVYGLLQQRERLDRIGQSMMFRGISSIILLSIVISTTGRVFYGILAVACARLVVLALFDLRNARKELVRGGAGTGLRQGLAISIKPRLGSTSTHSAWREVRCPLGLVMMLVVLSTNMPRLQFVDPLCRPGAPRNLQSHRLP